MVALALAASIASATEVTFENDVMAVLSKAGCNLGACHANTNGKGGFKLSLRGENPQFDYDALARQHDGRRLNLMEPESSLMLQKPTSQLAHLGGKRFRSDSLEHEILLKWIAGRAPGPSDATPKLVSLEVKPE